jgi:MOSC domain-containing protein YiiM
MRVLSVNVGQPREVEWKGRRLLTAIFKEPVAGSVRVTSTQIEGDRQADLSVHGGPSKAVYAYPAEHYAYWREELGREDLAWGAFGENLTVEGLDERELCVGDAFDVGSARLVVTQARIPCFKLGIRFGDPSMIRRMLESRRPGFYFGVEREGALAAGDAFVAARRDPRRVTVAAAFLLYLNEVDDLELLERAIAVPALTPSWRRGFERRRDALQTAP